MPDVDPLRARYEKRIGSALKKYRLDEVLGIGGMAVVFRATHRNGHSVAIKLLHREHSIDADLRARFLREGYVGNKVGHPGVVRVLDDDVDEDGSVFLVMDLLEGETLQRRWQRSGERMPVEDVVGIAGQLLEILGAAHAKSIVHRDIKPENIFLEDNGTVRVLDFGIARLRDGASSATVTRTGSTLGTPAFMPPEQALGKRNLIDARTDLWAVSATMFTALSGEFVHRAETVEELVVVTATQPARPVASVASGVPPEIAEVIDRGLAFKIEDRWPSAAAMRDALEGAFGAPLPKTFSKLERSFRSSERIKVGLAPTIPSSGESLPNEVFRTTSSSAFSSRKTDAAQARSVRARRLTVGIAGGLALTAGTIFFLATSRTRAPSVEAPHIARERAAIERAGSSASALPATSFPSQASSTRAAAPSSAPPALSSGTKPSTPHPKHHPATGMASAPTSTPAITATAAATQDIFKP